MIDLRTADLPDLPGALCTQIGPTIFFPEERGEKREALAACRMCPARTACLEYALEHHTEGIWGGTSPGQRRRILAERKAAA